MSLPRGSCRTNAPLVIVLERRENRETARRLPRTALDDRSMLFARRIVCRALGAARKEQEQGTLWVGPDQAIPT